MVECIEKFFHGQRAALKKNDIENFLCGMIDFYRELCVSQSMQGRHIASREFDEMCQEVGQLTAFELLRKITTLPEIPHHVILITELYCLGGHVEIVRDIVRSSDLPILLVASNINDRKKPVLQSILEEENVLGLINADESTHLDKLRTVQAALANSQLDTIFMLTHGYDAVAVAAITSDIGKNVMFFHHCDHYPALGCYLQGARHIDLHNVGYLRCRNEFNMQNNRYMCLSSMNLKSRRSDCFANPCLKTASCGGLHKILNTSYHLSYKEIVLHILQSYKGVHFHVGHLHDDYLRGFYNSLEHYGLSDEQFIYLGEVPNLSEVLTQLEIDFYLPTLPQSGGKAIIDTMAAGIPILAHQNARDRLWGSIDLIYPSAPTWATLVELDQVLRQADEVYWRNQARDSRAYFDRFHSETMFLDQLRQGGVDMVSGDIPDLKPYKPEVAYSLLYAGFRQ